MSNFRILITGGAGCLGSNLVEHFFPKGYELCVIDNFATGKKEVIPEQERLKVVEGDISDELLIEKAFYDFQPEYVIHSAAAYKDPSDWIEDSKTNVLGTINVVKSSVKFEVKRLINFQTALCYGRPNQVPIPVNHSTKPFTSYGISKTAGETYLINSDLPTTSLRLANICGPRLAIGPIPTFYKRLKAAQNCFCSETVRDFLDMSDFFKLIDLVIMDDSPTGVFNVSTGVGHSIYDVYQAVCNYLNIEPPEVPIVPVGDDDVPEVVLDPSETERAFNWKALVDFQHTISNQLKWYDEYGINDIYSHLATPKKTSETF
jgi:nucleoside-diphosphate-sugar epimerase